jgi:hypothetical protein
VSKFQCLISDKRVCKPTFQKDLVFIIGSGNHEFTEDLNAVKEVLGKFGLKGYFALLSDEEKGLDAFCDKICSQILCSQFCVAMLNDPIALEYIDKKTKDERIFRAPRANVYYEFGIAVALKKRIVPIIRKGMNLPFDVQHLDADIYEDLDDLKEKLEASVRSTLLKPNREEIIKEPRLELSLLDSEGKPTKNICVTPTFTLIKKEITKSPLKATKPIWFAFPEIYNPFATKKPSEDLVPIRISITNEGERVAAGIYIFLYFPPECELIPEREFSGFIASIVKTKPKSGGLYVDSENKSEAWAWVDVLGNGLTKNRFDEVYVRFKPEEREYVIKASVTQHNYPMVKFEFSVSVKPKYEEAIEYVYEASSPIDVDAKVLENRIKDLGKKDEQKP